MVPVSCSTDIERGRVAYVWVVHAVCNGNPALGNGTFKCATNSPVGGLCNGTCSTGYIGAPSVVCQSDSTWSAVDGSCQRGGLSGNMTDTYLCPHDWHMSGWLLLASPAA
jgi:hypothetical protein